MSLRKDIHEERQNQLRWQVKVGEGQMSPRDRHLVLQERSDAWEQYKVGTSDDLTTFIAVGINYFLIFMYSVFRLSIERKREYGLSRDAPI